MKYDGIEDDIEWMLNGEEKVSDWEDIIWQQQTNWSLFSMLSEVCLQLARHVIHSPMQQKVLVEEGLKLSKRAESNLKDKNGNATNPVAYSFHSKVYSELQDFYDGDANKTKQATAAPHKGFASQHIGIVSLRRLTTM